MGSLKNPDGVASVIQLLIAFSRQVQSDTKKNIVSLSPALNTMATAPPSFPSAVTKKAARIASWIAQLPPSLPAEEDNCPLNRKHASSEPSMATYRVPPAKRQRRDDDDVVFPEQSVSAAGGYNTSNPPSSQVDSRASSPASSSRRTTGLRKEIVMLKKASPPIITGPCEGAELPPDRVTAVMGRLEPGKVVGWIPESLKEPITSDMTHGGPTFDDRAFSHFTDPDFNPQYTLGKVKKIFQRAQTCYALGRDENAWCQVVIQPLVKLALKLSGRDKLLLQSVHDFLVLSMFSKQLTHSGNPRSFNHPTSQ
ncbi:hypothetical protein GQ44DRAFT_241180 [Phaeosphaeriaceae sp. PMI808]|nr:hypothetical protein GQ44DRAFT_241180 [Phaeosphaeriaceae sp. PMI808]